MRTVEAHLLADKMEEAVTHYMDSHHTESAGGVAGGVGGGAAEETRGSVLQPVYTHLCRQVCVVETGGGGTDAGWGDELLEGGLAAIVAQLQGARQLHKAGAGAGAGPLPPLRELCADAHCFTHAHDKTDSEGGSEGAAEGAARASRRSLPHKKRISRKLKRGEACGAPTAPCEPPPDPYAPHELRPVYICQICGHYYAEDQLKFYQHLRHHYEPEPPPLLEEGGGELALPDSIVELSLEGGGLPRAVYYAPPAPPPPDRDDCEFSEPEDLMAGIRVCVDGVGYDGAPPPDAALPHLTVDSGHVTQEHAAWRAARVSSLGGPAVLGAPAALGAPSALGVPAAPLNVLKEEVLQRIFEGEMSADASFPDETAAERDHVVQHHVERHAEHEHEHERRLEGEHAAPSPERDGADSEKRFRCAVCARAFHHRNSLLYHSLSHGSKQHHCLDCGKDFYTHTALKVHRRVHSGDRPYKCDLCPRDFRQWSDLKYHHISLHTDKKAFKCEYCGKAFARKYSLSVHVRIHTGERNYKCDYCSKSFRASSYRRAHMRTHTGDRPHKCEECDKSFRSAFDLRRHALVHGKVRARRRLERAPPGEEGGEGAAGGRRGASKRGAPPDPGFLERLTALYDVPSA